MDYTEPPSHPAYFSEDRTIHSPQLYPTESRRLRPPVVDDDLADQFGGLDIGYDYHSGGSRGTPVCKGFTLSRAPVVFGEKSTWMKPTIKQMDHWQADLMVQKGKKNNSLSQSLKDLSELKRSHL
jgi:hypothetical protein